MLAVKCYNFRLANWSLLTAYCGSAGQARYYLLLTGLRRLFAQVCAPKGDINVSKL
jgi:hypothetical protein